MNKTELIAAAAEASGIQKKDAERFMNAALDIMAQSLRKGEKVQLSGLGRNPKTREAVEIPPARVPDFKPSQNLKEIVK